MPRTDDESLECAALRMTPPQLIDELASDSARRGTAAFTVIRYRGLFEDVRDAFWGGRCGQKRSRVLLLNLLSSQEPGGCEDTLQIDEQLISDRVEEVADMAIARLARSDQKRAKDTVGRLLREQTLDESRAAFLRRQLEAVPGYAEPKSKLEGGSERDAAERTRLARLDAEI